MADGFEENVEFFTLTYEAPLRVATNREFTRIAPLLWLRAGAEGGASTTSRKGWDVADAYGVLADLDHTEDFLKAVAANERHRDRVHRHRRGPPVRVDRAGPTRARRASAPLRGLLRNFEIESGRGCAVKFTLKDYQERGRRGRPAPT